ncbi:hypothetical protein TNIN_9871 [Trichonephila inaurata madagascariensis]|uniref:Uncharacterized protein n=1 Tax=Trichonephila inaurata madagascariensis TaxID=2747483 RepID=A0A8X6YRN8_9ARAC|nr:hypothetical protein TNIN_9871 [Trichonephila inaurata madagascariensis]
MISFRLPNYRSITSNRADEKPSKRSLVRLSLRCTHRSPGPYPNPPAAALRPLLCLKGNSPLGTKLDRETLRYDET